MVFSGQDNSVINSLTTFGRKGPDTISENLDSTVGYFLASKRQVPSLGIVFIVNFFLIFRSDLVFGTYKKRFIKNDTQVKICGEMTKTVAVDSLVSLYTALDEQ